MHAFENPSDLKDASQRTVRILLGFLNAQLDDTQHRLLWLMSLLRHSITPAGLNALVQECDPQAAEFDFHHVDHTALRWVMKKVFPPQLVLNKLRSPQAEPETAAGEAKSPIEAYYQLYDDFPAIVLSDCPEEQQGLYHERLGQFYLTEKNKHVLERVYSARTRHLITEHQFHAGRAKRRRGRTINSAMPFPVGMEAQSMLDAKGINNAAVTKSLGGLDKALPWPEPPLVAQDAAPELTAAESELIEPLPTNPFIPESQLPPLHVAAAGVPPINIQLAAPPEMAASRTVLRDADNSADRHRSAETGPS